MSEQGKKDAIGRYEMMLEDAYSVDTVRDFAFRIRELVKEGEVSWQELGFTDGDVATRLLQARIRDAKKSFQMMLEDAYSVDTVRDFAFRIRELVKEGEVSWQELGFTERDVEERISRKAA